MKNIAAAMILARAKFPAIHKNKLNPHYKNKYASLDSIIDAITPALCEAGVLLVQPTIIRDGLIILSTQLIHGASGESIESELIVPGQSDPQKLGSALTYYRRFSICSLLSIAADDDDDGDTAASNAKPKSIAAPHAPAKLVLSEIAQQYQSDVKRAFIELGWSPDRKAEWAKTINSLPIPNWGESDWAKALEKVYNELDRMNDVEKRLEVVIGTYNGDGAV